MKTATHSHFAETTALKKRLIFSLLLLIGAVQGAAAQRYATILYYTWANSVMASSLTGSDVKNMAKTPYGGGYNWWGTPYYVTTVGDKTIKNNYLLYSGDSRTPNRGLIDYHANLLTQGGIDFITIDFSNGSNQTAITEGAIALCNRYNERLAAGLPTPKVAFFVRDQSTLELVVRTFFNIYRGDLFFNYAGKKLVMVAAPNPAYGAGDSRQPAIPTGGIYDNYTCRTMWGLNASGKFWSFKNADSTPPPAFVYNGQPEQMAAPVACQSSYMTLDGTNPAPGAQGRQGGAFFSKYMDAAKARGVKFVFITEWNEWTAINFETPPKGKFVDLWKTEYSADIEPMAGGHGDFYYQLMKQKIAAFKGTAQSPYAGIIGLPGTVQAENFDNGGEGVAYHDADANQAANSPRAQEAVDTRPSTAAGSPAVGWTQPGEWLEYSVTVAQAGRYTVATRLASPGATGRFHLEANGQNLTGTLSAPNTGGWENWQTVDATVTLAAGPQVLRLAIEQGGFDIDKITATAAGPVAGRIYRLVSRGSGQVLDVSGCAATDGTRVQQWPWLGGGCQRWLVQAATGTGSAGYVLLLAQHSQKALDLTDCREADGAAVQQWPNWGGDCQQWRLEPTDNGYYRLLTRRGGRALAVATCPGGNGALVQTSTYQGSTCQQWKFEEVGPAPASRSAAPVQAATPTTRSLPAADVHLFPNPAQATVTLLLPAQAEALNIVVRNLLGQSVLARTLPAGESNAELRTAALTPGVYLVQGQGANVTFQQKLVIE